MRSEGAQSKKFEYISGVVERITYHNEENGFVVLKVKVKKQRDLVAVTGEIPSITVGEEITAQGNWVNNLKYGLGFKAHFIRSTPPNSIEGIEKYLGSGLIKGIGPFFAKKLVSVFKEGVFDIIENHPNKLHQVEGIGKVRAAQISKNWADQKVVREIMMFLQSNGVGTSRATRIYKTYGEEAIKIVSENPYQLAKDIRGIGFLSADKIAKNLGIGDHSIKRARAGINFTLAESLNEGHCGLPKDLLLSKAETLLEIPKNILLDAIDEELKGEYLTQDVIDNKTMVFLTSYYVYEKYIAQKLIKLQSGQMHYFDIDHKKATEWVEAKLAIILADNQKEAIAMMLKSKVSVITGGPGTGKTTIMNSILKILRVKQYQIKLCAPTGRAAKRLSETVGLEAFTIHRLLKFDPIKRGFQYNQDRHLECDVLVVDESSMVDVQLFYSLLRAVSDNTALILVGDVDQLPSVGAGQILKDIIDSKAIAVVRLNKIFRQGEGSNIITNAHLVNKGMFPKLNYDDNKKTDFHYIALDTPEEIAEAIVRFTKYNVRKYFKLDPVIDTQILCPMQRGSCGARSLNNPSSEFFLTNKVLQNLAKHVVLQEFLTPKYRTTMLDNIVETFVEIHDFCKSFFPSME